MTRGNLDRMKCLNHDTVVVIPTYNERENVGLILQEVLQSLSCDVLVVDDESPDRTGQLIMDVFGNEPRISLLVRREKPRGLGPSYVDGFRRVLDAGYQFVIQMDADFSHDPSALPMLRAAAEDFDLVIGSRYVPGGQTPGWGWGRRIISRGGGWYARQVLRLPIRDLTGGYKCWRSETLRAIDLGSVSSTGFVFQIETTYRAACLNKKIQELPIRFCDRKMGNSKMSSKIFLEGLFKVWRIRFQGFR